jgi:hypothetical protein
MAAPTSAGIGKSCSRPLLHSQVAAVPVAVFESQRDDLVSAKPKTRQKQQHGAIAQADSRTKIATVDRRNRAPSATAPGRSVIKRATDAFCSPRVFQQMTQS